MAGGRDDSRRPAGPPHPRPRPGARLRREGPGARPGRGRRRPGLRTVGDLRRLARAGPPPRGDLRPHATPGRGHPRRPRPARADAERDGTSAGRRRAAGPLRRPGRHRGEDAAAGQRGGAGGATPCGPCALARFAAELGFAADPEAEAAGPPPRRQPHRGRARADLGRAAPPGVRRRRAGGPGPGRADRRAGRGLARALRAAQRRAEPLPPPRRLRPHPRRAGPHRWSSSATSRPCSAISPRGWRRCSPSRWPTSSRAARRCASPRCSTTWASPPLAESARTAGSRSSGTTQTGDEMVHGRLSAPAGELAAGLVPRQR